MSRDWVQGSALVQVHYTLYTVQSHQSTGKVQCSAVQCIPVQCNTNAPFMSTQSPLFKCQGRLIVPGLLYQR